jgi:NitT/TauT family transport system permease protein
MDFIYHRSILNLLSMSAFLTLWYGLALFLNADTLPSPVTVAKVLITEIQSGQLSYHLSKTLYRLSISFSIAMLLGCAIGIVLGRHQKLNTFLDNWLVIFLNIPALVTIILCYVWFGLTETAAILARVIKATV